MPRTMNTFFYLLLRDIKLIQPLYQPLGLSGLSQKHTTHIASVPARCAYTAHPTMTGFSMRFSLQLGSLSLHVIRPFSPKSVLNFVS